MKSALFKPLVVRERVTEAARADNNRRVPLLQPENCPDFIVQILNIIAVALLTEAAKLVKILS